jgi:hypothetical protein
MWIGYYRRCHTAFRLRANACDTHDHHGGNYHDRSTPSGGVHDNDDGAQSPAVIPLLESIIWMRHFMLGQSAEFDI